MTATSTVKSVPRGNIFLKKVMGNATAQQSYLAFYTSDATGELSVVGYSPSGRGGRREAASALAARRRPPVLRYIASAAPVTASVVEAAASTDDDTASPVLGCFVFGFGFGFWFLVVLAKEVYLE